MNITFKFFLNANDGKFTANGSLGSCDAKAINQISMPMAMIRIDTGTINEANFNFTGNDYAKAIAGCVIRIGTALHTYFPYDRGTDKNELPDDIVFGR